MIHVLHFWNMCSLLNYSKGIKKCFTQSLNQWTMRDCSNASWIRKRCWPNRHGKCTVFSFNLWNGTGLKCQVQLLLWIYKQRSKQLWFTSGLKYWYYQIWKKEEFRSRYQVLVDDLTLMVALCYCHFGTLRVYNQTTIPGAISLLKKILVLRRGPSKTQLILTFKVGKGKLTPWSIVWRVVQYSLPVHLSGATRLHDSYETWKNVYILGCMLGVVLLESL